MKEEPPNVCDIFHDEGVQDYQDMNSRSNNEQTSVEEHVINEKEIQCDIWQELKEPDFYFECEFISFCEKGTQVVTFPPPVDSPD